MSTNPDADSAKHAEEVSLILMHQTREINPCNISLPESDDEGSCVWNVVDPGQQVETDGDANEDVLALSVAGRDWVPDC
jgi:hypothetical protein